MKKLLLLLWACVCAYSATTTISDTVKNPDGSNFTGSLTIRLAVSCTQNDGTRVESTPPIVRAVSNGVITPALGLYPNTTCTPSGTYYTVTYRDRSGNSRTAYWTVTTSSPATIDDIETDQVPALGLSVAKGQITGLPWTLSEGGSNQTSWTASRCVQVSSDGTKLESANDACGSANPGGADTQVQFNESGAFGASVKLAWNRIVEGLKIGEFSTAETYIDSIYLGNPSYSTTIGEIYGSCGADSVCNTLSVYARADAAPASNGGVVAAYSVALANASNAEVWGANLIAANSAATTGAVLVPVEVDTLIASGTTPSPTSAGLINNVYNEPHPGPAFLTGGSNGGTWTMGLLLGGIKDAGGVGVLPNGAEVMDAMIHTGTQATYNIAGIVLAKSHEIRWYDSDTSNYFGIKSQATQPSDYTAEWAITAACDSGRLKINSSNQFVCDTAAVVTTTGAQTLSNKNLTDPIVNDLIIFTETAGDDTCNVGDFWLKANSTTNTMRKCENGSISDVGSGGGAVSSVLGLTGAVDWVSLTENASPAATDWVAVENNAGGTYRKVQLTNLPGGGGGWTDGGTVVYPSTSTDDVAIGGSTSRGKLTVDGDTAAEISQVIRLASAQTADALLVEGNTGSDLAKIDKDGLVTEGIGVTTGRAKSFGNSGGTDTGASSVTIEAGNTTAKPGYLRLTTADGGDVHLHGGTDDGCLALSAATPGAEGTDCVLTQRSNKANAGSGTDTYTATLSPAPSAYVDQHEYCFDADVANTGAASINFNSLGALTIKKHNDQDLETGDIEAGQKVCGIYDGTNFQMTSQLGQAEGGASSGDWIDVTGGVVDFRPNPRTLSTIVDEFCGGTTTTFDVGDLNWGTANGSITKIEGTSNHPCEYEISTSATINTVFRLQLNNSTTANRPLLGLDSATWRAYWIIKLDQTAETTMRMGFVNQTNLAQPSAGIYFEGITAGAGAQNWDAVTRSSSTETSNDTSVAMDTSYHTFEMRGASGTITFYIDGTLRATNTTNLPSATLMPAILFTNTEAVDKTADVDNFTFWIEVSR